MLYFILKEALINKRAYFQKCVVVKLGHVRVKQMITVGWKYIAKVSHFDIL